MPDDIADDFNAWFERWRRADWELNKLPGEDAFPEVWATALRATMQEQWNGMLGAALRGQIAELQRDAERFRYWFGPETRRIDVHAYLEGVRKKWPLDEWRLYVDEAMDHVKRRHEAGNEQR